jgi:hypothetical protein
MKSIKVLAASAFVFALLTPVFAARVASAQTQLRCFVDAGAQSFSFTDTCDLSIIKEVSVNGGAFVDANTAPEAAQAHVGDSVVWRITVSDTSETDVQDYYVGGTIQVYDDPLPAQVSFDSYSTSDGSSFDSSTGTWEFTLDASNQPDVVLTINTTATNTGLAENNAFFAGYACDEGEDGLIFCEYSDFNFNNNLDYAFAEISAAPVVLGDTTPVVLAATGNGVAESLVAAGLIVSTLGLLGYSRFANRQS